MPDSAHEVLTSTCPINLQAQNNVPVVPFVAVARTVPFFAAFFHFNAGDRHIMMRDNCAWRGRAGTPSSPRKETEEMCRLLGLGLLALAGCAGTTGPRMRDANLQKVDAHGLSIPEQQNRAKASLPYSNIQPGLTPRTWAGIPEEEYGQRFSY
jgi:hypothetical protein